MKNLFFWIAVYLVAVFIFGVAAVWQQISAEPIGLSEIEQINKYRAEELIKSEMHFLAMWNYVENMSEQEYYDTFFKVQHDK